MPARTIHRRDSNLPPWKSLGVGLIVCVLAGCPPIQESEVDPVAASRFAQDSEEPLSNQQPLATDLSRVLRDNQVGRRLTVPLHGAWQVLHGILAYGEEFVVDSPGGQMPALQYLIDGGSLAGFEPQPGDAFGSPARPGLRMTLDPTTKVGQGHRDQWLAVLAQAGLEMQDELVHQGRTYRVGDWVRQMEYDVPLNYEREFSWTLIALAAYRDTDHRWTARDGNDYNVESLLNSELSQNIESSSCGGTHRLIGIATALNRRIAEKKPIVGVWSDAKLMVEAAIELAHENQNSDGSYSASYFHRPGWTMDLAEGLGTTGHVLEFLAIAAPDDVLQQRWVERSARHLVKTLDRCRDVDLECGVLYHALHGLKELERRLEDETLEKVGSIPHQM